MQNSETPKGLNYEEIKSDDRQNAHIPIPASIKEIAMRYKDARKAAGLDFMPLKEIYILLMCAGSEAIEAKIKTIQSL